MRVLIATEDVFAKVGGGEAVYQRLITDNPGIAFTYFRRLEPPDAPRPPNTVAVPLKGRRPLKVTTPLLAPPHSRNALEVANAYAQSVSGAQFDVVDLPDFLLVGPWLRAALDRHAVQVGAIVQAMHGVLSDSISRDWDEARRACADLADLEEAQYRSADHRYALSGRYASAWTDRTGLAPAMIDPLSIVRTTPVRVADSAAGGPPQLLCVGRRERRKGNDLAIEIGAWLPAGSHGGLVHIGSPSAAGSGRDSDTALTVMAERRGARFEAEGPLSQTDLLHRYAGRCVVLVPVRYDSFNLVALEAVAAGAPLAVSEHAGVCDYLDALPHPPPYLRFDPTQPEQAAARLEAFLACYDTVRPDCIEAAEALPRERPPLDMTVVYRDGLERAVAAPRPAPTIRFAEASHDALRQKARGALTRLHAAAKASRLERRFPEAYTGLRRVAARLRPGAAASVVDIFALADRLNGMPERTEAEIADKLALIGTCSGHMAGRATVWKELARLHRRLGEDLHAAVYGLRVLRSRGADPDRDLAWIGPILRAQGMTDVAAALEAQYGDQPTPRLREILLARESRLLAPPPKPAIAARRDQRRPDHAPKVSIIVSLYKTGGKLTRFLQLLQRQSLLAQAPVELILVDANSPDDEAALAFGQLGPLADQTLYLRTQDRISIQAAWNAAVGEARAPYLCFLGVDETLYPTALETLAETLDKRPDADWAMSSSLVCAVDGDGGFAGDKMFYDRHDAARDMTLLDTTYLSWVGGLYRRSLHDRLGYYDATFRAAGDTEFKMRLLSRISVAFVPQTLGQFRDYPDDRASASARAELEDSLAWYAHRTPAGIGRISEGLDTAALVAVLRWCAGRRKCYSATASTDLELGVVIAGILAGRADAPPWARQALILFTRMRDDLRHYDFVSASNSISLSLPVIAGRWRASEEDLSRALSVDTAFHGVNDNRFDQHSWFWGR